MHVAHTILCKPLVQTVECGSQEAPNDPHHDEETQIQSCPEMTFFIRVRALREGGREGERKTRVAMRAGRERNRDRPRAECLASLLRVQATRAHCSRSSPHTSSFYLRASFRVKQNILGGRVRHTLNSPKFSNPGSWKEPQLPN